MAKITIKLKGVELARQATTGKLPFVVGRGVKASSPALHGKVGAHAAIQSPVPALPTAPVKALGGSAYKLGGGVAKGGTIWTGTGSALGLGVGLGTIGPILLVTALGLVATGIYIYLRNQSVQRGAEEPAI